MRHNIMRTLDQRKAKRANRWTALVPLLAAALLLGGCQQTPFGKLGTGNGEPKLKSPPTVSAEPAETPPSAADKLDKGLHGPEITEPAPAPVEPGTAFAQSRTQLAQLGVTRVALLSPLSGRAGKVGRDMLNAAQLAMFEFGDDGFELLVYDTGGTPEGAATAADQALGDGAGLILGPLLSESVKAVGPVARRAGVNVIAFSNDRNAASDGVFLIGFLPSEDVRQVAAYAMDQGITRFATLAPSDRFGRVSVEALRQYVTARGGQVVESAFYDPAAEDFNNVVRGLANYAARRGSLVAQRKALAGRNDEISIKALQRLEHIQTIGDTSFDALLVADGGKRLQAVAALLPYYDIDPSKVHILGTGRWDIAGIGAEPGLTGAWYAAPPRAARAGFVQRFTDTYGHGPERLATLAYDATALAAVLARAEGGPKFDAATLTMPSGFAGRDGIFRFRTDGLNERNLAIWQLGERDNEIIAPAKDSFPAQTN